MSVTCSAINLRSATNQFDTFSYDKIHSNPGVRADLFQRSLQETLVTDFFGGVARVEVDDDVPTYAIFQEDISHPFPVDGRTQADLEATQPSEVAGLNVSKRTRLEPSVEEGIITPSQRPNSNGSMNTKFSHRTPARLRFALVME